jgi:hypothetical protein
MMMDIKVRLYMLVGSTLIGCQQISPNHQIVPPTNSISPSMSRPVPTVEMNPPVTAPNSIPAPTAQLDGIDIAEPIQDHLTWKPSAPVHEWKFIVLHHTASQSGSVESINRAHLQRKDAQGNPWKGIGYHFVIGNGQGMGDGEIQPTFRWNDQMTGAHAGQKLYNEGGIGVCLVGNFEENPPSKAQLRAVRQLVGQLKNEYDITTDRVLGHHMIKTTACPGKLFPFQEIATVGHNDLK